MSKYKNIGVLNQAQIGHNLWTVIDDTGRATSQLFARREDARTYARTMNRKNAGRHFKPVCFRRVDPQG